MWVPFARAETTTRCFFRKETTPNRGLCFAAVGRRRLIRMRASPLVVVVFALLSGCSPDEPDVVTVVPEPRAPEPNQVEIDVVRGSQGGSQTVLNGIRERPVHVQTEEECRQLVELEARLQEMLTRYTEQHPQVRAARSEIARLRGGLPADGTFCSEQLEQRRRTAEQLPQQ